MKLWLLRKLNAWSAKRLAVQSSELLAVRLGRAQEALRDIRERVEHCQTRERLDSELQSHPPIAPHEHSLAPSAGSARPWDAWDECPVCDVKGWVDCIGSDYYHCRACKAKFTKAEAQNVKPSDSWRKL